MYLSSALGVMFPLSSLQHECSGQNGTSHNIWYYAHYSKYFCEIFPSTDLQKLQYVQNSAARLLTHYLSYTNYTNPVLIHSSLLIKHNNSSIHQWPPPTSHPNSTDSTFWLPSPDLNTPWEIKPMPSLPQSSGALSLKATQAHWTHSKSTYARLFSTPEIFFVCLFAFRAAQWRSG